MKVVFLAVLLLAIALFVSAQETKEFLIRDFLVDQTDRFDIFKAQMVDNKLTIANSTTVRQMYFKTQNETTALTGNTYFNNTETQEISNVESVSVTFSGNNTGKFIFGDLVLEFDFSSLNNLIYTSVTKINSKTYQIIVPSPDRFILTVINATGDIESAYIAKKVNIFVEKTFFQAYGTFIMMAGLMALNLYVQSKTRGMQQEVPEPEAVDNKKNKKTKKD